MRNLYLTQSCCVRKDGFNEAGSVARHISIDFDTSKVYIASDANISCFEPSTKEIEWTVDLRGHGYDYLANGHHVVSIQHLPGQQAISLVATNGDVLLYNTVTSELECVGSVENGLCCMSWSPDQELVVMATAANTLLLMTKDFEPILETALEPEEFGEQKPITVGWGKKETQFHGSVGKQAATRQAEDIKPALAWDDRKISVSWRGDGEFFVVSSINGLTGARQLRVWNRECVLQCTSENVIGLEQGLSWKPSGSLIASSQVLPHRHDIVFFEKNGLRHGEFTLPFEKNKVKVNEILWNTESTILAVWLEDLPQTDQTESAFNPQSYVQLWTCGNYHWYLKQSLHFAADDKVATLTFDPEHANQLHLLTEGGKYMRLSWTWQTACSRGLGEEDHAVTAVIDGKDVLVTPFKKMVVPPPISAYTLQLPTFVNQVVLAPPPHSNDIAVVMQDGHIAFYTHKDGNGSGKEDSSVKFVAAGGNGFKSMVTPPRLRGIAEVVDGCGNNVAWQVPFHLHHFEWVRPEELVALRYNDEDEVTTLHRIKCVGLGTDDLKLVCDESMSTSIFGEVVSLSCRMDGSLVLQLNDGTVVDKESEFITKLPQRCSQMALCTMGGKEVVLGLTERYRFYVNEMEVASNCTSFAVTNNFLILTTHSHTCRCISLDSRLEDLQALGEGKAVSLDESVRRVERGSRIVTAIASDTRLILQMPRGNLETIHPRALVLASIKRSLDALQYKTAFEVMRRHRINMNLIFDHNPNLLLDSIDNFVTQLDSSTSLNLFLMDLIEENVTTTLYMAAYRSPAPVLSANSQPLGHKVNVICDAILNALYRVNPAKFFLSILACHAKKTEPELEKALEKIKELQGQRSSEINTEWPTADEALRYLLYLVDVNDLFNVALGTYDFDLVIMVAEKSQKDPKEYLPFLNKLRSMETNYQRYSIDKHLKRYVKALGHISKCPDHFSECLELVRDQRLFPEGLKLFKRGSKQYKEIAESYAEYLQEKNRYQEAGLVFEMCNQLQRALLMYEKCGNWRGLFSLTPRLKLSPQEEMRLARKIAGQLADNRRHSEAASVLIEYASDVEEAITVLVSGGEWEEALRLMYKHNRTDFIETTVKPALIESFENKRGCLANFRTTFEKHKSRLAVVRENKLRQQDNGEGYGGDFNELDADLYSDASSVAGSVTRSEAESVGSVGSTLTAFTAYSEGRPRRQGRAGKNRRKGERKKMSLKEGSLNEDVALMEALALIIKNVDSMRDEMAVFLRMLVRFEHEEEAKMLQDDLQSFLTLIKKSLDEIWPTKPSDGQVGSQAYGPQATTNSIVASMLNPGNSQRTFSREELAVMVPPKITDDQKWKLHLLDSR